MKQLVLSLMILAWNCCSFTATSQVVLTEHIIQEDFMGATGISSGDFNGDGFVDLVVTANTGDKIGWFENDGNQHFTEHIVVTGFDKAKCIVAAKIDANETLDFVASSKSQGKFSWFGNDGAGNFTEHVITDSTWTSADYAEAADLDDDGDQDLVLVSCDNHKIAWAENDGSGGFTVRMLKENWTKANWADVADLDKDADKDIVATAKAGQIIWFKNDGTGTFSQDTLYDGLPGVNSVRVADLDGDGDMDLAGTACDNADLVAWFENDGNYLFTMHLLKNNYNGARACEVYDMDRDGDTEILSIAWTSSQATLWENDGSGHFTERIYCPTAYDLIRIHVVDLDLDSDPDIVGACFGDHEIRWWENINTFMIPDFTADSLSGHQPLHPSFTDLSMSRPGIHHWYWDFDNDGIVDSQAQHPSWVFTKPGSYTVKLVVASDSLTDSIVKPDYIRVFDEESALEFNGSNSRLICNPDSIPDITGSFTFEAWIMPEGFGTTGLGRIFDKRIITIFGYRSGTGVPADSCFVITMMHSTGVTSTVYTPSGSMKLHCWQHLAVTYHDSSGSLKVFIDGVEQQLEALKPPDGSLVTNKAWPIVIGNSRTGNLAFQGSIDEIRLWSVVRSSEQINDLMGYNLPLDQPGLLGYWKLNEGAGDTIEDLSGNCQTGIRQNARWAQGFHLATLSIDEEGYQRENNSIKINVCPNPVMDEGRIEIQSNEPGMVSAGLYDVDGIRIKKFPEFLCIPGKTHFIRWDGNGNPGTRIQPGMYILKVIQNGNSVSKKVLLLTP